MTKEHELLIEKESETILRRFGRVMTNIIRSHGIESKLEFLSKSARNHLAILDSGKRYHEFNYKDALDCAIFYQKQQDLPRPFVLVCENPIEAQFMFNTMQILWDSGDRQFLELFNSAVNAVRQDNIDYVEVEKRSNALFEYVLPICVSYMDLPSTPETADLIRKFTASNDDTLLAVTLLADNYYSWQTFCEATGRPYWIHYKEYQKYQQKAGIFTAIVREDVWVISKYPKSVSRTPQRNALHNLTNSAIEFGYSHPVLKKNYYFINGRRIFRENIFEGKFTFEEFLREPNEEIRAAMYANIEAKGPDYLLNFLKLEVVDSVIVAHEVEKPVFSPITNEFMGTKKETELEELTLYRTTVKIPGTFDPVTGKSGGKIAYIKFTCPSTGTNYLIATSPSFNSAIKAAEFSRPFQDIPSGYRWTQRS